MSVSHECTGKKICLLEFPTELHWHQQCFSMNNIYTNCRPNIVHALGIRLYGSESCALLGRGIYGVGVLLRLIMAIKFVRCDYVACRNIVFVWYESFPKITGISRLTNTIFIFHCSLIIAHLLSNNLYRLFSFYSAIRQPHTLQLI